MIPKHTPGPWTYYLTISDQGTVPQVQTKPIGPVGGQYATMICTLSRTGEKSAIREANARLIAAAPDLLSALVGMMNRYGDRSRFPTCDASISARAAISKAEGNK